MKHLNAILITLVLLLCSTTLQAQEHLKFMGIPLNMSIDAFQKRLEAKCIYPDKEYNRTSPVGSRSFLGKFTGRNCHIYVYYDNNKTVYRAKAVYGDENEVLADQFYNDTKLLLERKYTGQNIEYGTFQTYPCVDIYVMDADRENRIGIIQLYKVRNSTWPYSYRIHVDYTDYINNQKHEDEKMDDL